MDQFANDPDFQYLALDRKKLLEEAPPYDAKTSCWAPDDKLGFIRANITATKGDDVTVQTENHEVSGSTTSPTKLIDNIFRLPML